MSRLLTITHLQIEGHQEGAWQPIVSDLSLTLERARCWG